MSIKVSYMVRENAEEHNGYTEKRVQKFEHMSDVFAFINRVKINPRIEGRVIVGLPTVEA